MDVKLSTISTSFEIFSEFKFVIQIPISKFGIEITECQTLPSPSQERISELFT